MELREVPRGSSIQKHALIVMKGPEGRLHKFFSYPPSCPLEYVNKMVNVIHTYIGQQGFSPEAVLGNLRPDEVSALSAYLPLIPFAATCTARDLRRVLVERN